MATPRQCRSAQSYAPQTRITVLSTHEVRNIGQCLVKPEARQRLSTKTESLLPSIRSTVYLETTLRRSPRLQPFDGVCRKILRRTSAHRVSTRNNHRRRTGWHEIEK